MNPRLVALATVLDVVVLVGLGVGIFFAPLTLVWAFDDGFSTELLSSWAVAVQGWFLGHAVPLEVTLPLDLAQSLGLGVVGQNFRVDVALLGIALLTVLWGYRIGARESTRRHPLMTWFLAVGIMVGLSFLLVYFLPEGSVSISSVDAVVRPPFSWRQGWRWRPGRVLTPQGGSLFASASPEVYPAFCEPGLPPGLGPSLPWWVCLPYSFRSCW